MDNQGVAPSANSTSGQRLGSLMRRDRQARGLRQADVAEVLHVERSNVSQFETGSRLPSPDYLRRWQANYGPNRELQAAYQAAIEDHGVRVSTRKARRDAATSSMPIPGLSDDTDEPAAIAILQALSDSALSSIQLSWNLWQVEGDATALDSLGTIIERLEQAIADSGGEFRRHALALLGYAHEAMGKRAFDRLRYTDAIGHFREMHELGTELADPDLSTLAMLHLGDVARRRQRYTTAISLLDGSEPHARAATARVQGLRWQTLARAHAECGHQSLFLQAIGHAEACIADAASDAALVTGLTATEIHHEEAHGLTLLGDSRAALAIYQESEPTMAFRGIRERANFLIIKAQALAGSGDLDEGVRLAVEGLDLARSYDSARHVSRVQRMYDRLHRAEQGTNPHLATLRDALAAA